jgi:hypothetical protein
VISVIVASGIFLSLSTKNQGPTGMNYIPGILTKEYPLGVEYIDVQMKPGQNGSISFGFVNFIGAQSCAPSIECYQKSEQSCNQLSFDFSSTGPLVYEKEYQLYKWVGKINSPESAGNCVANCYLYMVCDGINTVEQKFSMEWKK